MTSAREQSSERSTIEPVSQVEVTIGQRRGSALIVAFFLFGGLNFVGVLVVDLADSALAVGVILGGISAELALTATWAVLGPSRVLRRFLAAFLVTIGLSLVSLGAFATVVRHQMDPVELFSSLLPLPSVFLAAQVPLWLLRFAGGYQLVDLHQPPGDKPAAARQFGLGHLFGATTVLAVAFGLVNCGIQLSEDDASQEWMVMLVIYGAVAAYVGLTTLPSLWVVFGAWKNRGRVIVLLIFYSLALGFTVTVILSLIFGPDVGNALVVFVALHAALVIATVIPFGLLRRLGYRLERLGKTSAVIQPDTADHGDREIGEGAIGAETTTSNASDTA